MNVLIEDSPRNLLRWMVDAVDARTAAGAVLSPFATPWVHKPHARDAQEVSDGLKEAGGQVWFDASTHALQMAGVGDFNYYDEYSLWSGPRGDLHTPASRADHIRRVFEVQDTLGAQRLGPTILLNHSESTTSLEALELAQAAVDQDPRCWLTVAGTAPFWASGPALDAHIGALAQLAPAGWFLTVARTHLALPVTATDEEVHGLCRTTRALAEYVPVHISHGDLAALPAVAAGARSVGSGWDQRQRVCAFPSYSARDPDAGGGGGWYVRPTYRGLLGSLKVGEAAVLTSQDPAASARLGPPPPPGPKETFLHHMAVLDGLVTPLAGESDHERRYRALDAAYTVAARQWPRVVTITGSPLSSKDWVEPLQDGLRLYGAGEGW